MPKADRTRNHVWGQTLAPRRPKNSFSTLQYGRSAEHWCGRTKILKCKNPQIMIDALSTAELWKLEDTFIRPQNIDFDRHVFLITKQARGETVDHF